MKLSTLRAAIGSACIVFGAQAEAASHGHLHAHNQFTKRYSHDALVAQDVRREGPEVEKRATCSLPSHPDLVHVPGASNNGFAMSPDQPCLDGGYCPIACVPGKVMAQWKPHTTYKYPESMDGGLLCKGGEVVKPFPDREFCMEGTGTVQAVNHCLPPVSFCQTVLPGDESMLIPTVVDSRATLAVPGPDYWSSTAAHYYVNPPGVSPDLGCAWGDASKPYGNWSPYVAGANTDANGLTYVKIAYNPIWTGSALSQTKPMFGIEIECPDGGCNGIPCSINPATDGIGVVKSPVAAVGVGDASFCVVTVPKGGSANIVVFNLDNPSGCSSSSSPPPSHLSSPAPPPLPSFTVAAPPPPPPVSTSTQPPATPPIPPPISFSVGHTTPSSSSLDSSTANSPSPDSSASTQSPSSSSSSSSMTHSTPLLSPYNSSTTTSSSSSSPSGTVNGGVFRENSTSSTGNPNSSMPATTAAPVPASAASSSPTRTPTSNEGAATGEGGAAIAGLIVALVAAAALT